MPRLQKQGKRKRRLPIGVPAAIAGLTVLGIAAVFIVANMLAVEPWAGEVTELEAVGHGVEATANGPDIHFAAGGVDLGVVPLNKEVSYAFSYANVGNSTLVIEKVDVRVLEGC